MAKRHGRPSVQCRYEHYDPPSRCLRRKMPRSDHAIGQSRNGRVPACRLDGAGGRVHVRAVGRSSQARPGIHAQSGLCPPDPEGRAW